MKTILRVFSHRVDSATCSYKNSCIKWILILSVGIFSSLHGFSQFTQIKGPPDPPYPLEDFPFSDGLMDFGDMLTGYYSAYVFISPSGGGKFWFYQTVDGGATWILKDSFPGGNSFNNYFLFAVNKEICFTAYNQDSYDMVRRVSDNGETWHTIFWDVYFYPGGITKLNDSVLFMTAMHEVLDWPDSSCLYRIEGDNYFKVFSIRRDSLKLLKPLFISPDTGFIISQDQYDNRFKILRTFDAGLSWQTCFLTDSLIITDIGFFTKTTGAISCSNGCLFKTMDAGTNWESIKLENSNTINSLDIVNENIGYCGGDSGSFFKTVNQGQSWNVVTFPNTENIIRLHMIEENFGYISTSAGVFYRYSDVTGIAERSSALIIFPNPASDIINISFFQFMEGPYEVNLVNALGILIYSDIKSGNRFSLDLSGYATGIYFLIVKQGTAQFVEKIIRK